MRILIVLSRVPYPLEKGDKLRAYHQIRILSERHSIVLCCLSDSPIHPDADRELSNYCEEIHILQMSKASIARRMLTALFSRQPYQVHYFRERQMKRLIEDRVTEGGIDHIYCQLIRCADLVKDITSVPKTIDYMDALSLGMERRISGAPFFKAPFIRAENRRLRRYERAIHQSFDSHTIISEVDRDALDITSAREVAIVRNGVDMDFFSSRPDSEKEYDLVFVGNLSYRPNVDCIAYLVKEILPLIQQQRKDTSLLLAGADPNAAVQQLASAHGVILSGWVDDIREAYSSARLFVAPMRIGSGLQNKLLESLAMEVPAITSSLANRALGAAEDKEVKIGDSAAEVAECCLKLLDDPEMARLQAVAGRRLVENRYSWSGAVADLEKVMNGAHEEV